MNANCQANAAHPQYIVIAIDTSGSHKETILFEGRSISKAEGVALILNRFLSEAAQSCQDNGRVRNVYVFSVCQYSDDQVRNAFVGALQDKQVVSVSDLIAHPLRIDRIAPAPGEDAPVIEQPVWVEPHASGDTPMCRGFDAICGFVSAWIANHPLGPAPVVMNVSDGQGTDGDAREPARRVTELRTDAGNVVLFNIALSREAADPIVFPAERERLPDKWSRALFDMSSVLPDALADCARRLGMQVEPGAKAIICNAQMRDLMRALITGSQMA